MTNSKQILNNDTDITEKICDENIISNDLLEQKIKNKAKVRITAYQARILMDGIDGILDSIDEAILKAVKQNLFEITYELPAAFSKSPIYSQIKTNYINRGFIVNGRQGTSTMSLNIKWAAIV
ncbi:MAG: hypothetical protein [Wendovervirus sonii]|uniref:Phage protein n=1 Tax=phage Lak_Megaphage_Sonny TaxID=3109229 RepID=A0ABZ0Z3A3_9CAUD|nr:MAG: hypothetical protein [phage Lak_Megaphage_Sonny]